MSDPATEPVRLLLLANGKRWMTSNHRLHFQDSRKLTKMWREAGCEAARSAQVPAFEKAHLVCVLHFFDRRRRDPANWYPTAKAVVDGIVDAGVLADDDATRVTGPDMRLGDVVPQLYRGLDLLIYPTAPPW